MMELRRAIIACVLVFLIGCAPTQESVQLKAEAAVNEDIAYCDHLLAVGDFQELLNVIPQAPDDITPRHLALEDALSEPLYDQFVEVSEIRAICAKRSMATVREHFPKHAPIFVGLRTKNISASALLLKDEINIGQYNAIRLDNWSNAQIEIAEVDENVAAYNAAVAEANRTRQLAASVALLQIGQQFNQPPAQRSTITNCRWVGSNWICNSTN